MEYTNLQKIYRNLLPTNILSINSKNNETKMCQKNKGIQIGRHDVNVIKRVKTKLKTNLIIIIIDKRKIFTSVRVHSMVEQKKNFFSPGHTS